MVPFPIIAAVVAGLVTGTRLATDAIERNDARNMTEDQAVQALNQWEARLAANLTEYMNGPATSDRQRAALAVVDEALAWLRGTFAQAAALRADWRRQGVADRVQGGRYDWYRDYRDPIANDSRLQGLVGPIQGTVEDLAGQVGLKGWQLLLLVAMLIGGAVWWRYSRK